FILFQVESLLRKIIGLVYEVEIFINHCPVAGFKIRGQRYWKTHNVRGCIAGGPFAIGSPPFRDDGIPQRLAKKA
ncbi:MAG TPA: hypothetical protein VFX48_00745, partial [Saprospiraceae bacterium]|nr:hypothetical protein [Saprospiraceae bacterium]